jgi:phosphate-selective porin OprO/OprP
MSLKPILIGGAAVALLAFSTGGARAETKIQQLENQIQQLQQNYQGQIQNLQGEVDALKEQQRMQMEQAEAVRNQAAQAAAAVKATHGNARSMETKGHEFGFESADGQNSIYLTGRIHFDTGAYFDYSRKNSASPLRLQDGENFRRARIGVQGQFLNDFNYALIYDFGGSSDSLVNANSGSLTSGVENAYITYNGLYKHHVLPFPIAFDIGAIDVPWTLDEATSSNDIMFIERASSQVIATAFGGGDFRTAFGARSNDDRYFLAAYVTGPTTGALHTYGSGTSACVIGGVPQANTDCNGPQMAFLTRGSYQILQSNDASLHIGVNFGDEFRPRNASNLAEISLSDRPELRIDPTSFLSTGSIASSGGWVIGAEAAAAWQNAFIQGEYYHYTIDQLTPGFPSLNYDGGYVQGSYSFGGRRQYKPAAGAYSGVIPDAPLSFATGGWGALELAGRYSVIDLDSGSSTVVCPASASVAVLRTCGGLQRTFAIGLNYYPNNNMRFMLDFEHVDISAPTSTHTAKAAEFDDVAFRTQVNF